jgi:hypothetical protein
MKNYIITIVLATSVIPSVLFSIDPRYHTYEEMIQELNTVVNTYPSIAIMETIGYTTGFNIPIPAIKISRNPRTKEDEPTLLFTGIHHACEIIGVEICLALIWDLVTKYGNDSFITLVIDSSAIWIVPMVNPDGHYIVVSGIDTLWRKNCRDNNNNSIWDPEDGVDLNRNYDFLWHLGGSSDPANREYRGPYPFSENETRAIRNLALQERFIAGICFHSHREWQYGEAVYYPWRWGNSWAPDSAHIRPIAESIAASIPSELGSGYTYTPIYGRATEGGLTRNWLYYAIGTFSYTIEVSRSYFPPGNMVDTICARNLRGVYYLLRRVFGNKLTGHVRDSVTLEPLQAEVRILEAYAPPETIWYRVSDSLYGRFYRLLKPGNYTVQVIKPGYQTKTFYNVPITPGNTTYLEILLCPHPGIEEKSFKLYQKIENQIKIPPILNNSSKIELNLTVPTVVRIDLLSSLGTYITTIADKFFPPGKHSLTSQFNLPENNYGIFFVRTRFDNSTQIRKVIIFN